MKDQERQQGGLAEAPIARPSIDIAARMAAKSSFRIQLTSFAAQTVPAQVASQSQPAVTRERLVS